MTLREKIEEMRATVASVALTAPECDHLLRTLDVMEAVEWIEAQPVETIHASWPYYNGLESTRQWWLNDSRNLQGDEKRVGIPLRHGVGATIIEAVNALRSALNKEKS